MRLCDAVSSVYERSTASPHFMLMLEASWIKEDGVVRNRHLELQYDIITSTETPAITVNESHGRGVLIAVRNHIKAILLETPHCVSELIFIDRLPHCRLVVFIDLLITKLNIWRPTSCTSTSWSFERVDSYWQISIFTHWTGKMFERWTFGPVIVYFFTLFMITF